MRIRTFIVLAVIIVPGYILWNSDTFQKHFTPKRYWSGQVESLKSAALFYKEGLEKAEFDLNRKLRLAEEEIEIIQKSIQSKGKEIDEAKKRAEEIFEKEVKDLENHIRFLKRIYQEAKERMESASRELAMHQI